MKKLCCMVALAAISFGTICAAAPVHSKTMMADTTVKVKKKKMKVKTDTSKMKMKMKKDTAK
jgi:hypothetical protein